MSEATTSEVKTKKPRRIFWWIFAAIQIIFIAWLAVGLGSADTGGDAAKEVGTAIGAGLVIGLWVAVDVIMGITYGIYRLAKKNG